jgi:hypothetical protein
MDIEQKLRQKAGKDADKIVEEVRECPDHFVMEGGADGTYSHVRFWDDYGHLMPEISDFAEECGGQV